MCKIWIFGGTTEGRLLAEYCSREKIEAWVSVASDNCIGETFYDN